MKHVLLVYFRPFEHGVWLSDAKLLCHRARAHCQQRRSLVSPNQGFWRSLCAFEEQLGITERQAHLLYMMFPASPSQRDSFPCRCSSLYVLADLNPFLKAWRR